MTRKEELNLYRLDDVGFIGSQSREFTEEDRMFLRNFFVERKKMMLNQNQYKKQMAYA